MAAVSLVLRVQTQKQAATVAMSRILCNFLGNEAMKRGFIDML
jgi:hypothetical protein